MKCLDSLVLKGSGFRELPSSLGYLTRLTTIEALHCHNLNNFPNSINKVQLLEDIDIPVAKSRLACKSFDHLSGYGFLSLTRLNLSNCGRNIIFSNFYMNPAYFPMLNELWLSDTDIVTIPECFSRFPRLVLLYLINCSKLRGISRLPKSIRVVYAHNCSSLDPESSSRLLNQVSLSLSLSLSLSSLSHKETIFVTFPKYIMRFSELLFLVFAKCNQFGEIVRFLPSSDEGERENEDAYLILPGTEIPKWFKFNHQIVGNSVSFWVGRKFQNISGCFAFRSVKITGICDFYISINGCKSYIHTESVSTISDEHLWLFTHPLRFTGKSTPSERNHIEITWNMSIDEYSRSLTHFIKWCGVHVECICCGSSSGADDDSDVREHEHSFMVQEEEIGHHSLSSDIRLPKDTTNGSNLFLGSTNLRFSDDIEPPLLLPLFPTSCLDMDQYAFNNAGASTSRLSMETTPNGDGCDLSLLPSFMVQEDIGHHSLSSDIHLPMDPTNLGFSDGFDLGSSSAAHTFANNDSDTNLYPPLKKMRNT